MKIKIKIIRLKNNHSPILVSQWWEDMVWKYERDIAERSWEQTIFRLEWSTRGILGYAWRSGYRSIRE